jgi:hypothetical protein
MPDHVSGVFLLLLCMHAAVVFASFYACHGVLPIAGDAGLASEKNEARPWM